MVPCAERNWFADSFLYQLTNNTISIRKLSPFRYKKLIEKIFYYIHLKSTDFHYFSTLSLFKFKHLSKSFSDCMEKWCDYRPWIFFRFGVYLSPSKFRHQTQLFSNNPPLPRHSVKRSQGKVHSFDFVDICKYFWAPSSIWWNPVSIQAEEKYIVGVATYPGGHILGRNNLEISETLWKMLKFKVWLYWKTVESYSFKM